MAYGTNRMKKRGTKFKLKPRNKTLRTREHYCRKQIGSEQVINLAVVIRQVSVIFILLSLCYQESSQATVLQGQEAQANAVAVVQESSASHEFQQDSQQQSRQQTQNMQTLLTNSSSTSEIAAGEMDDLLSSESRMVSGEMMQGVHPSRASQLRKLLTRPGLFLSSIVPPRISPVFTRQLVLDRPHSSLNPHRSNEHHDDRRFHSNLRVPRLATTSIRPGHRPMPIDMMANQSPLGAGPKRDLSLLFIAPSQTESTSNDNKQPVPMLVIRQRPATIGVNQSPPSMFDDDDTDDIPTNIDDESMERELVHIDQLIKDEFENRINLNEHIARDPNQFRASSRPVEHFNGTTSTAIEHSGPSSTVIATATTTEDPSLTTIRPSHRPVTMQDSKLNGPRQSLEAGGFRPVKPANSVLYQQQSNTEQSRRPISAVTLDEQRKSLASAHSGPFMPSDLGTIAQLKQKTVHDSENLVRLSRDNSNNNSSQPLFRRANPIRVAQSSPSFSVSSSSNHQFGIERDKQDHFVKQTGITMHNRPSTHLDGWRQNQQSKPSLGMNRQRQQQRLNDGRVGLTLADSSNVQHQMSAGQQQPFDSLSETLKRLRETKARIKQLQAEINATDPVLLMLDPLSPALPANISQKSSFDANNNNNERFFEQVQTIGLDESSGQQRRQQQQQQLALSGGTPVRSQSTNLPFYPRNPLTAPARLMVSAFGRAAQTAIATQAAEYSSWPSLSSSTVSSRIPLLSQLVANNSGTTSAPIILSSSMSVTSSTSSGGDSSGYSTTANLSDADAVQLTKPVDLTAGVVTTPAAASTQSQTNDYSAPKVTNKELHIISSSSSYTNRTSPLLVSATIEPQTSESADNRIDTRVIKLPDEQQPAKHANEPYQFRYQERPRSTATPTVKSSSSSSSSNKPASRREEQSNDDLLQAKSTTQQPATYYSPATTTAGGNKLPFNETINRMSHSSDASDRQSAPDKRGANNWTIGQSVGKFFDQIFSKLSTSWSANRQEQSVAADARISRPKLTTERVLVALITFVCSAALVCVLAVFAAVRCQAMRETKSLELAAADQSNGTTTAAAAAAGPRLDWRKLITSSSQQENAADRFRHDKLILDGTMRNVSLLARQHHGQTGAKKQVEKKRKQLQIEQQHQLNNLPAPLFKQTCCHCVACSESRLSREDGRSPDRQRLCSSGFYHPAPRGKLPFGAASSVNKLLDGGGGSGQATSAKQLIHSPAAQFARNPIGGTRLRMMSAIDELRDHHPDQCSCSCQRHQARLLLRPIVAVAAASPSRAEPRNVRNANVGPGDEMQPSVASSDADDLCNCCRDDRDANLTADGFSEKPLLNRNLLSESSGGGGSEQRQQQLRTNCKLDEVDSINVIRATTTKKRLTTRTSAKTAADCESNAVGDNDDDDETSSRSSNNKNNKCSSGIIRAKLSAGGGGGGNNSRSKLESGEESEDEDHGDAHSKSILSSLQQQQPSLPSVIRRQRQQECNHGRQQQQRCPRASVECLHANHTGADSTGCCDHSSVRHRLPHPIADPMTHLSSAASVQQERLRHRLMGGEQHLQRQQKLASKRGGG